MTWTLGLTVGPDGFGSAVRSDYAQPHLIGVFPTAARAVSAGSLAAPDTSPSQVVLVHPAGIAAAELGRHIGDLTLAGVTGEDIELRSDVEVLAAVTGNRVLLVDADLDQIAGHPGRVVPFDPDRLAALVAEDPFATTVALTGDPELRDRYHVAARDYAPMLVERPALAALALDNPTTSALVSTPRTGAPYLRKAPLPVRYFFFSVTGIVAFVLILVLLNV